MNDRLYKILKILIYTFRRIVCKNKKNRAAKIQLIRGLDLNFHGGTKEWNNFQKRLYNNLLNDDLGNFLQWNVIKDTMFFNSPFLEFKSLQDLNNWKVWRKGIRESCVGNPTPYKYYLKTSGNLVHHAYSLSQLVKLSSLENVFQVNKIIEFGGGYGSFCRLIYNLGYNGEYEIIDFEIFSRLQKYFLEQVLDKANHQKVNYHSDLEKVNYDNCLFVGLWSLSETSMSVRKRIVPLLLNSKYILIAYQNSFSNIDNKKFFDEYLLSNKHFNWKNNTIGHLPGHNYIVGVKK